MDPNTALRELREAIAGYDNDTGPYGMRPEPLDWSERMRDAAVALDEWLSKGGFLPDAWQADRST